MLQNNSSFDSKTYRRREVKYKYMYVCMYASVGNQNSHEFAPCKCIAVFRWSSRGTPVTNQRHNQATQTSISRLFRELRIDDVRAADVVMGKPPTAKPHSNHVLWLDV
jgi:hypothetical protein